MRALLGILVAASMVPAQAIAAEIAMSCSVEDTTAKHARRTFDLSYDQSDQLVYISKTTATAAITSTMITFRVDLGTGVPFNFAINRTSGAITVTANAGALYNEQCKVVEAKGP